MKPTAGPKFVIDVTHLWENNLYLIRNVIRNCAWDGSDVEYFFQYPNGEVFKIPQSLKDQSVTVPLDTKIFRVRNESFISHYTDDNPLPTNIDLETWRNRHHKLTQNFYNDEDGGYDFGDDIDAEYNYKKFQATWKPVHDERKIREDGAFNVVQTVQFDTGNPFIKSVFTLGSKNSALYSYNQKDAVFDAFVKKMESLGMEAKQNLSYEQTKDKKVWSMDKHNTLRYAVAFGTYIFTEKSNPDTMFRIELLGDKLDVYKALYENDVSWVNDYLDVLFNKHFNPAQANKLTLSTLHDELKSVHFRIDDLEVKTKSAGSKVTLRNKVNELIALVEKAIKGGSNE